MLTEYCAGEAVANQPSIVQGRWWPARQVVGEWVAAWHQVLCTGGERGRRRRVNQVFRRRRSGRWAAKQCAGVVGHSGNQKLFPGVEGRRNGQPQKLYRWEGIWAARKNTEGAQAAVSGRCDNPHTNCGRKVGEITITGAGGRGLRRKALLRRKCYGGMLME